MKDISSTYAGKTNRHWRNGHALVRWLVCALATSNCRLMASPRRCQTSCQSFGCYDMRWGRPRDKTVCPISRVWSLWQQKPMSESEATFPDDSSGKHPSHTICHPHLLSIAPTVWKYLRNVLSLLFVCERLVCFAFFELECAN